MMNRMGRIKHNCGWVMSNPRFIDYDKTSLISPYVCIAPIPWWVWVDAGKNPDHLSGINPQCDYTADCPLFKKPGPEDEEAKRRARAFYRRDAEEG